MHTLSCFFYQGYHPEYFRFFTKCLMDAWEMELGEEFITEVRTLFIGTIVNCTICEVTSGNISARRKQSSFLVGKSASIISHLYFRMRPHVLRCLIVSLTHFAGSAEPP